VRSFFNHPFLSLTLSALISTASLAGYDPIKGVEAEVLKNTPYEVTGYFAPYHFGEDSKSNWTFTFASTHDTYRLLGDTSEENIKKMGVFGWVKVNVKPNPPLFYMVNYKNDPFGWVLFDIDEKNECKHIYKLAGQDPVTKSFSYDIDGDGKTDELSDLSCRYYPSSNEVDFFTKDGTYQISPWTQESDSSEFDYDSVRFTEPLEDQQWYLHRKVALQEWGEPSDINLDPVIGKYTGKGVKIGFIVFGPDLSHEDLRNLNVKGKYHFGGYNEIPDHATKVMGVAVADVNGKGIRGIAPDADVYVLEMGFPFMDEDYAKAFRIAKDLHLDVVVVSGGAENSANKPFINDLKNAIKNGVTFVYSAGNSGGDMSEFNDETSLSEIIVVGASDGLNQKTGFSSYGENLDILAPGEYILTTTLNNSYEPDSGTSLSAPIVGGVVALMKEANPDLTPAQIEDILHKTADKIGRDNGCFYDESGKSYECGYGKINAAKAIKMAEEMRGQ